MNHDLTPEERRHVENLRAVAESLSAPAAKPRPAATAAAGGAPPRSHRTRNGLLGTLVAGALLVLGKLKFVGLLATVLKLPTLLTMLLSIGVYATQWGLPFATGFVLLIFVHELGHWIVIRREGLPAGAPVFIPFVGALISLKGRPRDAGVEARVALGGPVLGSLGAWAVMAAGLLADVPMLVGLGHVGAWLNLFNLLPVAPLDGGRAAGAFSRAFWIAGYTLGLVFVLLHPSPILILVMVLGLVTLWQRWRHPVPGYHAISRGQRLAIALVYGALVVTLVLTLAIPVPGPTFPTAR